MGRSGLRSGVNPSHNIVVSGDNAAGSKVQKEVDSCKLVFRAASEMDNPGILRVLRSSPRALPGAVSAPGQSSAGSRQSSGQVRPGQTGSREQGSESGASAAGGGTLGIGRGDFGVATQIFLASSELSCVTQKNTSVSSEMRLKRP